MGTFWVQINQSIHLHLLTMPTTQTEDKTQTKMVEVELTWDLQIGVPTRYKCEKQPSNFPTILKEGWDKDLDGTLTFTEKEVNPYGVTTKVLVPVEATTSYEALKKYVHTEYQNSDTDIGSITNLNIWDSENKKFLFD